VTACAPALERRPPRACPAASPSCDGERALAARLASGDEAALAELYDRYGHAAYGLALRVLQDPALAEDAVQEGFLCVWRLAAGSDPSRAKLSTWLLTLVHRRAVDLVRRSERRRAEPLDLVPDEGGRSVHDELVAGLERRRVRAALELLPVGHRSLLELAYYGGLTQSEIAERTGQPLGTGKSRTFTALCLLRDLLGDETEPPGAVAGRPRLRASSMPVAGCTRRPAARS